jgi:hypothetical protein
MWLQQPRMGAGNSPKLVPCTGQLPLPGNMPTEVGGGTEGDFTVPGQGPPALPSGVPAQPRWGTGASSWWLLGCQEDRAQSGGRCEGQGL